MAANLSQAKAMQGSQPSGETLHVLQNFNALSLRDVGATLVAARLAFHSPILRITENTTYSPVHT